MISGRLIRPLLALALLTAALGTVPRARAEILEEIVAKVNNEIITLTEFEARLELFRQQISRKYSGDDLDAKMEESRDLLLHNMIIESLLVQRGDVILDMEKVRKNLLDDFKKQQKIENDAELDKLLNEQKMTRKDLLDTLVRLSIPQEIINYEVRRKISVSDKEIQAYYDAHRQDFVKPERVTFREIIILFEEVKLESREAEEVTPVSGARDTITEKIRDQKSQEKVEAYLQKLWADNFIYVFPKYGTAEWKPTHAVQKGWSEEP